MNKLIIALLSMKGLQIYTAQVVKAQSAPKFTFPVVSMNQLNVGDCHIIELNGNFTVVEILAPAPSDSFIELDRLTWAQDVTTDPRIEADRTASVMREAEKKIARAQAAQAIRALLETNGLTPDLLEGI